MNVTAYNSAQAFDALKPEWNDLVSRSNADCIFSTWEWQSVWWRSYQPGSLWVFACRDGSGRLVGLAPWFIHDQSDGTRVVSPVGGREVTDYLDIIVDREQSEAVVECLVNYIAAQADCFDRIELCNLPENSAGYRLLPAAFERHGFVATIEHEDVCPIIELPQTWDEYLASLDKKQRHEIRRKLRRAQGANESLEWHIVESGRAIEAKINVFLGLMAASSPEKSRFLADQKNEAFFRAMIPVVQQAGWLQLAFLTVGGEAVAAYLNFDYGNRILVYNSGLMQEEYGHLSPGIVLLSHLIQHAIQTHHVVFDFLQGDEPYKYRMGARDTHVYNLIVRRDR